MTSPLLSDVYRCRPKARPRYHKCEQKYDRSRGALAGTSPCLFAALMTLCSCESFLSQTDWRSITELPTSHKISRLDFTCKLWIVPLTTDQLCLWTSFYARGGWVNLKSEPVRGDRPQNWPKKLKTGRIRIYFPTCCREVLAKAVFFCFLILRWNIFYTDALLPYSTPISTISAMRTEGQRFVWGSSKAVLTFQNVERTRILCGYVVILTGIQEWINFKVFYTTLWLQLVTFSIAPSFDEKTPLSGQAQLGFR